MRAPDRGCDAGGRQSPGESPRAYLAFLSSRDVDRLDSDEDYFAEISGIAAVPSFAGFHYLDDGVEEGFTAPETQRRAYAALKRLFPGKLVLHPLRLDLASDPSYLDDYFRPEFTDLVVPYFYPVGRTLLGVYSYGDDWDTVLSSLLAGLRDRMPPRKGVLPVLQGFQQEGFAVQEEGFPRRQMDAYAALWPGVRNVAAFAWFDVFAKAIPLSGMARSPALQSGFRRLFESLAGDDAPDPERDERKRPPARTVLTTSSGAAAAP